MSEIGERLRTERRRLGMSQEEMGVAGGVTRNTQSNYEKGLRSPDAEYLAKVAGIGADVQYILTGQRSASAASLAPDEAALLDNYRHSSPEHKASLRTVGAALAKPQVNDGDAEDGGGGS